MSSSTNNQGLNDQIKKELIRLGAVWTPNENVSKTINDFELPSAFIEFSQFRFEPTNRFESDDSKPNTHWVWDLNFWNNNLTYLSPENFEVKDRNERQLIQFAIADSGNYLLALDLKDANPSDPLVYKLDHYDPEQKIETTVRLSSFLASLELEKK